jgi:hypothetical protein
MPHALVFLVPEQLFFDIFGDYVNYERQIERIWRKPFVRRG